MTLIETDQLKIRDAGDYWAVGGRAINWDTPALVVDIDPITGIKSEPYLEEFAPGSIMMPAGGVLLRDDHGIDVGLLARSETPDDGWEVELRIDKTEAGARVRDEIKQGKKHSFSIGFAEQPLETTFDAIRNVYRRTKALVKEISVTHAPQHLNTGVSYVRSNTKENTTMPDDTPTTPPATPPATPPEQGNLLTRSELDDALRDFRGEIKDQLKTRSQPTFDPRSPGEVWQALASGDEKTIREYENLFKRSQSDLIHSKLKQRAFPTEGVYANTPDLPAWVGDLTRLVEEPSILLGEISQGPLPEKGNSIEYGALGSDSTVVDTQDAEGDDLDYGYVDVDLKTAPVLTYGGYTRLSRQVIERSSVAFLDINLRAMALRAGKRINIRLRSALETALAAQVTAGNKVTITDETDWTEITDGLVDGVDLLLDEGLRADVLFVDKPSFKTLKNMVAEDGRSQMLLDGAGVNNIGELSLSGLSGRLAGIRVVCDPNWSYNPTGDLTNNMALLNKEAIRFRNSGITQLTDENIVNLSKDFALYFYGAIATEIPKGIIPIELTL
jgi:hypothetical protein